MGVSCVGVLLGGTFEASMNPPRTMWPKRTGQAFRCLRQTARRLFVERTVGLFARDAASDEFVETGCQSVGCFA